METYATREEALAAAAEMRGWETRVEQLPITHEQAGRWVIACWEPGLRGRCDARYVQTDGYVR